MRQKKVVISTAVLLLLSTGCVKPTDEPNRSNGSEATVYNEQPVTEVVYEDSTPVVYTDPNINSGSTVSNNTVYADAGTVISTDSYEPVATTTTPPTVTGPYDDPYAANTGGSDSGGYVDPYSTNTGGGTTPNYGGTPTTNTTYTDNNSYSNTTTPSSYGGNGIHLQVAALKDHYAAEEFKNGLSLPPQYSAYVKKGAMNKVIIKGFSSRSEAKALAARQFPGAFIVAGSSSGGGSSSTGGYTSAPQPAYTSPPSNSNSNNNGIGVQIGAFSSQATARSAAESAAAGRYTAIVKTVTVRGKTLYKAILIGFSSRVEAKSAIASGQFGNAFVVSNIYP